MVNSDSNVNTPVSTNYGGWLDSYGESWEKQVTHLKKKFSSAITNVQMPGKDAVDVPVVFVKKSHVLELLQYLKTEPDFEYNFLMDLFATDEMPEKQRFHMVYSLLSHTRLWRIRVKVKLEDGESMPTAIGVWPGANWAEREVWDMFGIKFDGHPDLRRILMDERWEGHPLRKDYPLRKYQLFPTPEPIDPKLLER